MLFCFSKLLGVRQHGQHAPCPQRQRCPPAIEARSRLHTAALQAAGQSYGRFRARAQPRGLSETPPRSPVAQRLIIALQVLYLVAIFTTSLLCPMLLVHLQQYRAAACWKRPPGTGAPARYPGFLGRAHQASSCAMRLGRTAEPFARSEAVARLEARPKWPTLRRPPHRRRHPGAMGRGRPRLSACAVRLTDMTLAKSGLFRMHPRHPLLAHCVCLIRLYKMRWRVPGSGPWLSDFSRQTQSRAASVHGGCSDRFSHLFTHTRQTRERSFSLSSLTRLHSHRSQKAKTLNGKNAHSTHMTL